MKHLSQDELDNHAQMWAVRAYVGEPRKPVLSPESDVSTNWWCIRAEAVKWDVPGVTVVLAETVGIDAHQYGYAEKVWFVYESDQEGRAGEVGPITFNRQSYIIRAASAKTDKTDNRDEIEQAVADWTSRTFGM